jgi:hypothetical protein
MSNRARLSAVLSAVLCLSGCLFEKEPPAQADVEAVLGPKVSDYVASYTQTYRTPVRVQGINVTSIGVDKTINNPGIFRCNVDVVFVMENSDGTRSFDKQLTFLVDRNDRSGKWELFHDVEE